MSTPMLSGLLRTQSWIKPAGHAGGDFILELRTTRGWRIVLADVSGHGGDAAASAGIVRQRIARDLSGGVDVCRMRQWNRDLHSALGGRFVCVTYLELDFERGTLTVANAGNPAVLVRRVNGRVESFPGTGPVLGVLDDREWTAPKFVSVPFSRADSVLCFTDGLTEQFNTSREPFGLDRVARVISRACTSPVRTIRRCVQAFAGKSIGQDDMTVLLLHAA
jgi:sigma-B regulation protein RsbU (phosphoserine phosphatase)